MRIISPKIDRDFILSRITEEDIFARYFTDVDFHNLVRNPLREDRRPTCSFFEDSKGRIICKDWGGFFYGDCFEVVKRRYGINYNETLQMIAKDFHLISSSTIHQHETKYISRPEKEPTYIQIKKQEWTEVDKQYWRSYHLNSKILVEYKVVSVAILWINGEIVYRYKDSDPAYAYYFGNQMYKIYFPFREENRFRSNTNAGIIQGYDQLPDSYDFLIITKALKDVMCLSSLGVPAIAPQAEGNILSTGLIDLLQERFPKILVNFDFDYTGVRAANRLRKQTNYNIQPVFLTNGRLGTIDFGAKDPAEYIQKYGPEQTKNLIIDIYNEYII